MLGVKVLFEKITVLLRSCVSFKPMKYNQSSLKKKQVACIIALKTNKPFREALKIYREDSEN